MYHTRDESDLSLDVEDIGELEDVVVIGHTECWLW